LELQTNNEESSRELRGMEKSWLAAEEWMHRQSTALMESRLARRGYRGVHLRQPAVAIRLCAAGHTKKLFLNFSCNGTG
jgi:hypothetical protein